MLWSDRGICFLSFDLAVSSFGDNGSHESLPKTFHISSSSPDKESSVLDIYIPMKWVFSMPNSSRELALHHTYAIYINSMKALSRWFFPFFSQFQLFFSLYLPLLPEIDLVRKKWPLPQIFSKDNLKVFQESGEKHSDMERLTLR